MLPTLVPVSLSLRPIGICGKRGVRVNQKGGPLQAARNSHRGSWRILPLAPGAVIFTLKDELIRRSERRPVYTPAAGVKASGLPQWGNWHLTLKAAKRRLAA